jgi:hypothetical protein
VEPRDAAADAAERAEAAGRRTREIAERLTRLAQGRAPDGADVQRALRSAEEARHRAVRSFERSISGHERAAQSHERAAAAHEEAARRGIGDRAEHERRAQEHRLGALADMQEAAADRARAPVREPAPDGGGSDRGSAAP